MRLIFLFLAAYIALAVPNAANGGGDGTLTPVSRAQWDRSTPEASFRGVIAANHAGDVDWILAGFAPDSRAGIRESVSRPDLLARNTAHHARIAGYRSAGSRNHRGYRILTVAVTMKDGETYDRNYPFKRTPAGWLLTNDLSADPDFTP